MTNELLSQEQILLLALWTPFIITCLLAHPKATTVILELRRAYLDWRLAKTRKKYEKLLKRKHIAFGEI